MLQQLRSWLNGNQDYFTGVVLYSQCQPNIKLLNLFRKGKTDYNVTRLHTELLAYCNQLKALDTPQSTVVKKAAISSIKTNPVTECGETSTLYLSALNEAKEAYKAVMNKRAVLFHLADQQGFEDVNMPNKVAQRSPLAIEVINEYNRASKLFDIARYVKEHGRLPNEHTEHEATEHMEAVPDALVKQYLDNARKSLSKLKKKEPNAKREELIQERLLYIKKLESRWHLLKPNFA